MQCAFILLYRSNHQSSQVVKLPLANICKSESQRSCALEVKTLGVAVSTGVQAERGFVVDREVSTCRCIYDQCIYAV